MYTQIVVLPSTVYTHFLLNLKILRFAPPTPQFWGEQELQSPPELSNLWSKITLDANQETYVYTVANFRGSKSFKVPQNWGI